MTHQRRWLPPRPSRGVVLFHVVVVVVLLCCSFAFWHETWFGAGPSSLPNVPSADPAQETWFFAWVPDLLRHGLDPFLSTAMAAGRGGFNTLSNTSEYAATVPLAPVTWLFGPVVAFNVAGLLAPVVTGYATLWCLRAMTSSWAAQLVGSVMFAFSPTVVANLPFGHLMADVLWYPPICLLALVNVLGTRRYDPRAVGIALGIATALQFFLGTEVLAVTAVGIAVGLGLWLLPVARRPSVPWRDLGVAAGVAAGVAGILLAYPLWIVLAGPQHVAGVAWAILPTAGYGLGAVIHTGTPTGPSAALFEMAPWLPTGSELGVGVVVFCVASMWRWSRLAWVLALTGIIGWLASLGTGGASGALGPFRAILPTRFFHHLPLLSAINPVRFSVIMCFGASMLLACSMDGWLTWVKRRSGATANVRTVASVVVVTCAIAALVPMLLTYPSTVPTHTVAVKPWFTSSRAHVSRSAPTLLYPNEGSLAAVALTGISVSMMNGYVIIPAPNRTEALSFSKPTALDQFLSNAEHTYGGGGPRLDVAGYVGAARTISARGIASAVVISDTYRATDVAAMLAALTDRAPLLRAGALVWPHLSTDPLGAPPAASLGDINACVVLTPFSARAVARCVIGAIPPRKVAHLR